MTAVGYARLNISRFAVPRGMVHIGGQLVGLLAERPDASPTACLGDPTPTELLTSIAGRRARTTDEEKAI